MNTGDIYISSQLRPNQQVGIRVEEIQLNSENRNQSRIRFLRLHPWYNGEFITLTIEALERSAWILWDGQSPLMEI